MKLGTLLILFSIFVIINPTFLIFAQDDQASEIQSKNSKLAPFEIFKNSDSFIRQISTEFFDSTTIWDLITYTAGMVLYSFFVWKFYRFIARREIIPINLEKYSARGRKSPLKVGAYVLSYLFLFPFFLFLWFFVYSFFIYFLARDIPTETVLLISITVIVATRVAAYYKEDLARDLGKLLPFSLLAIFLTSPAFFSDTGNFFSLTDLEQRFQEIPLLSVEIVQFILYAIFVEAFLRTTFLIKRHFSPPKDEESQNT